jgi:hypothetical protein
MTIRSDTKIAFLIQVMDELGFDQETIGKVTAYRYGPSTILPIGAFAGSTMPVLMSVRGG